MVLAHLRRRWSLSGGEGFGVFSPSQAQRDSGVLEEMKCLFSIAPEARKCGESPKCFSLKNSNRTLNRTRSRFDRMRPVSSTWCGHYGFATGASGPSRNRSIRSGTQRGRAWRRANWTRGASGHMRSDASGHGGSSIDSDRTPGAARLVKR
jgi:hypothetical protein